MADDRHLLESALYKENVFEHGHRSVWGSWYDSEKKMWGYACCRTVKKGAECPKKDEFEAEPEGFTLPRQADSDDCSEPTSRSDSEEKKGESDALDWSNPPAELRPRAEFKKRQDYVEHFVRYVIGAWQRAEDGNFPGFVEMDKARFRGALKETVDGVTPLLRRIKKGVKLERGERKGWSNKCRETRTSMEGKHVQELDILESMDKMASTCANREYKLAHETYMKLTLGNKMWNSTVVAHVAACTMKGAREYRRNRDSLNTYDSDPVSQRYMHAMKKLCSFMQCIRPNNDDHSKNVVF